MSLECPHCDRAELESRCDELRSQIERERQLSDQLAAALKDLMKYSAWVSVTSAKCEVALAQHAAMRKPE